MTRLALLLHAHELEKIILLSYIRSLVCIMNTTRQSLLVQLVQQHPAYLRPLETNFANPCPSAIPSMKSGKEIPE